MNGGDINVSKDIVTWNHLENVIIHNQSIDYEKKNKKAFDYLTDRGVNKYTNTDYIKEIQKYFSYLIENKIKDKNDAGYEIQNPITKLNEMYFPYRICKISHSRYINNPIKYQLMSISYFYGSNKTSSNDVIWKKGDAKILLTIAYDRAMQNKEIILDILQNINKNSYSNLDYINKTQNYYEYVLRVYREGSKHDTIELVKQELKLLKEDINLIKSLYEKEVKSLRQEFDSFKKSIEEQKKIDMLVTEICTILSINSDNNLLKIHNALVPSNNIDNDTDQKEIIKLICNVFDIEHIQNNDY
ncbi:1395_t:CDS:1 [Dentiscutata erythropus]|uniref:1395_t:CDS:1 n=1 Tax=Dentiscutata erythropus TaxID=1348616 RepID=A0A9N9HQD4_9GLOM|nr:1395_t:CDS:1 [Dentiscutata erythropus]